MNIVVIMLDSQRADYLGCGGNRIVKTSNIDKIASEGIFFEQATAEYPITIPSRTAFVSGNYTFPNRPWCPLRSYDMHIAEVLQKKGFQTAAFSDSPFSGEDMARGFQKFVWFPEGKCHQSISEKKYGFPSCYYPPGISEKEKNFYPNTMNNRFYALEKYGKACPELLFDKSIEWLETEAREPFFLWIDTFEPHEPWCPSAPYDTLYQEKRSERYIPFPVGPSSSWMTEKDKEHVLALYMGDVTHTDEMVGNVVKKLEEKQILDDTLFFIISDHGEPFGEHGTIRKYGVPVYEELARIVFIIRKPDLIKPGIHSKALVQNVDFAPTILDLLDVEQPGRKGEHTFMGKGVGKTLDGKSLVPIFKGETSEVRESAFCGGFCLRGSIRKDRYKFIDNQGEKPNELFDMENDPYEKKNLTEDKKDLVRKLHRELWDFESQWSASLSWRDKPVKTKK